MAAMRRTGKWKPLLVIAPSRAAPGQQALALAALLEGAVGQAGLWGIPLLKLLNPRAKCTSTSIGWQLPIGNFRTPSSVADRVLEIIAFWRSWRGEGMDTGRGVVPLTTGRY